QRMPCAAGGPGLALHSIVSPKVECPVNALTMSTATTSVLRPSADRSIDSVPKSNSESKSGDHADPYWALVGCHCGNPRDPQIVAEGLFSREPAVRGDMAPGRKVIRRTICPRNQDRNIEERCAKRLLQGERLFAEHVLCSALRKPIFVQTVPGVPVAGAGGSQLARLIVVSNRVSLPDNSVKRAGGLEVALRPALEENGGVWLGWSGKVASGGELQTRSVRHKNIEYVITDLSKDSFEEYYRGFANRVLWPILHYRLDLAEFARRDL